MKKKMHYHSNSRLPKQKNYIGGRYVDNSDGATFVTRHPGNDAVICDVETAGVPEISLAVASAREAFIKWSTTPAAQRGAILRRAAAMLRERNDELAALETLDTGKPIAETLAVDIATGADVMEYFAGIAQSIHGEYVDLPPQAFAMIRREPLGVCAGIGAWNYPIQIAMWKSSPALGLWQYDGVQAGRTDALVGTEAGRNLYGSRAAAGCIQRYSGGTEHWPVADRPS